jgi:hypothetical protein
MLMLMFMRFIVVAKKLFSKLHSSVFKGQEGRSEQKRQFFVTKNYPLNS